MKLTYHNKIIGEPLQYFYEEETFELPKRLGEKNHTIPFKVFINYALVGIFVINSYKLISDYIHLLEQEQFDEN